MSKILIIEDDNEYREMLKEYLQDNGFEILTAENGMIGCDLYRNNEIDVVVTDIYMPEQEGIETILTLNREYPDVNIIAMSGGASFIVGPNEIEQDLGMAEEFGVKKTLAKPFKLKDLLNAIKSILQIKDED